ncbi:MAG: hypothetical protein CSB01_01560 [Bacteroidia bacterium]|nr:MAG: hypothetical protein CSB01_01560 [Bacteroidia bacterium]
MIFKNLNTTPREKDAFRLHLAYSVFEGIIAGFLLLNEIIFIKSLNGTNALLAILFQTSVVILIFSIFLNELLSRVRRKRKLLFVTALITRAPLFLLFFFPDNIAQMADNRIYHVIYLLIFLIFNLANPIVLPIINLLLKVNYKHENFGKFYSYATSVKKTVVLLSTFFFGLLLDYDNAAYTYVFPFIGIMAIFSIYLLSKIDFNPENQSLHTRNYFLLVKESLLYLIKIVKKNKAYRDFEIGFMLYGFAFMISKAIIDIYMVKVLDLNFSSIAFYKNTYNTLAIITLPFFGKLIGKIDPRKFAIFTYLSMIFYILFLALAEYVPFYFEFTGLKIYYVLILSFLSFGIFTAMMALQFSIGSAYFCAPEEAANYQSIHLSLVGIRALFSPLVGIWFFELFGFQIVFSLANFSLFLGIFVMIWSMKRIPLNK